MDRIGKGLEIVPGMGTTGLDGGVSDEIVFVGWMGSPERQGPLMSNPASRSRLEEENWLAGLAIAACC